MAMSHSTADDFSLHGAHEIPQNLREWIDSDHHTDPWRPESYSVFLHNPAFTIADMQHALVYARDRFIEVLAAFTAAVRLATYSYARRIDLRIFMVTYGENLIQLPDDCLEIWQWAGDESETYIFHRPYLVDGKMVHHAQDPKFRRTITALCRLRTRMERDNGELRRAILWEQDEGRGPDPMVRVAEES
ncbi:hypothetical protein LTR91_023384 [Friedmanniomyces endolithicus]|uniref:Uncharacterized protein n=1 Tax=Friedmanniomyces endolithicus TaxID=329885 RepID=A0AAN6FHA9_9PEZI|nr:hypothetical protein LTR35_006718 [Friedmanniomyces endolithicus]KAK0297019.1 hypothetical protein LTS00_004298 [Friedmanniomyces endolithicus]KAK0315002.1 hypothetical protein LTR82_012783 [Friedmanniomyces endolithicus]KAK0928177.1 hypothetical protein LTR57_002911 [Friedmanniomyces endolithicus]KAK0954279.1 hypothetical protein LTR91_023384 [Friedmanniomyces endolithicus]